MHRWIVLLLLGMSKFASGGWATGSITDIKCNAQVIDFTLTETDPPVKHRYLYFIPLCAPAQRSMEDYLNCPLEADLKSLRDRDGRSISLEQLNELLQEALNRNLPSTPSIEIVKRIEELEARVKVLEEKSK